MKKNNSVNWFERFASKATHLAGTTGSFITAFSVILIWLITGPLFHFSDTWQLIINTGTTIVTFLMVFLIQKTQNKDAVAIQIKLNELVAASDKTNNRIISVEDMSEEELIVLNKYYTKLAQLTKKDSDIHSSHSIDEAAQRHLEKKGKRTKK